MLIFDMLTMGNIGYLSVENILPDSVCIVSIG